MSIVNIVNTESNEEYNIVVGIHEYTPVLCRFLYFLIRPFVITAAGPDWAVDLKIATAHTFRYKYSIVIPTRQLVWTTHNIK